MDNIYNLNITLFQNDANILISYWSAMAKTPSPVTLRTCTWHWSWQVDECGAWAHARSIHTEPLWSVRSQISLLPHFGSRPPLFWIRHSICWAYHIGLSTGHVLQGINYYDWFFKVLFLPITQLQELFNPSINRYLERGQYLVSAVVPDPASQTGNTQSHPSVWLWVTENMKPQCKRAQTSATVCSMVDKWKQFCINIIYGIYYGIQWIKKLHPFLRSHRRLQRNYMWKLVLTMSQSSKFVLLCPGVILVENSGKQ